MTTNDSTSANSNQITGLNGLTRFLASGLIKGVGPSTAKKIVDMFGETTVHIIESDHRKLENVSGISSAKATAIAESWNRNKGIRHILLFLEEHDIGISYAIKVWQRYGHESMLVIKNNPYVLFNDIKGIGFLTADKIALQSGIDRNSPLRAEAAIEYILQEFLGNGSCCAPATVILNRAADELSIERGLLNESLLKLLEQEKLIAVDPASGERLTFRQNKEILSQHALPLAEDGKDSGAVDPLIFVASFYYIERGMARKLVDIKRAPSPLVGKIDGAVAVEWLYKKHGIMLAARQQEGLAAALAHKCCVITGGPGTGKTTMLASLLMILREMMVGEHFKIRLVAPTGRAAKRLGESTGSLAVTIHRLLDFDPGQNNFRYNESNRLDCDFLILDESSMIDAKIMYSLLRALPLHCHMIIVGDVDQLPSVGPGAVLNDIIRAQIFPVIHLNQIFRQAAESDIVRHAHIINSGQMPKIFAPGARNEVTGRSHDCVFVDIKATDNAIEKINGFIRNDLSPLITEVIPNKKIDLLKDIQILSPMQKGPAGVRNLNLALQKLLNRGIVSQQYIEKFGTRYYVADKVMQTENNYTKQVFNGDIGFIHSIDYAAQELKIIFDHRTIPYRFSEMDQMVHAYAITIHKSQGSEYPVVIIPVMTQHFVMLNRHLIYTALTRARELAIFMGQRRALGIAVQNQNRQFRHTILSTLLQKMSV